MQFFASGCFGSKSIWNWRSSPRGVRRKRRGLELYQRSDRGWRRYCGALTGEYNRSGDHFEAVRMLELVGEKDAAKALNTVLQNKTMANYSDVGLSEVQVKQTSRLSVKLVNRARQLAP